jgi:hypothetical protein
MPLKFKPKLDKIVELLLHLAYVRPGADKYQAVKFFYLADREHLIRFGRPITFESYFALPYGPVASNAMDLLERDPKVMKAAGIDDLPFKTETKNEIIYIGEPIREVDLDLFSRTDLEVFDEVIKRYGDLTFDELYKLTHSHPAYKNAWDKRGYSKRAEMDYAEMVEDKKIRETLENDLLPIAAKM